MPILQRMRKDGSTKIIGLQMEKQIYLYRMHVTINDSNDTTLLHLWHHLSSPWGELVGETGVSCYKFFVILFVVQVLYVWK
jgi:hypothetical protein